MTRFHPSRYPAVVAQSAPSKKKHRAKQELEDLKGLAQSGGGEALENARRQIRKVAKIALVALVVIWALALGFYSGLRSSIPLFIAASFTVAAAVAAFFIWRNLGKSEEFGSLLLDSSNLSPEERALRAAKLERRIQKGDITAILTKAQLEMQDEPKTALKTLEGANLDKAQRVMANQVRGMRIMIHLNQGEAKLARQIADAIDLSKTPDVKSRANLAAAVAEAWARSGNPIEATELLAAYDPEDKQFAELRVQLLRARVFSTAHRNQLPSMRKYLKQLREVSPQLLALFLGQRGIHPLLSKEARKQLEKSGAMPKPKMQMSRRG